MSGCCASSYAVNIPGPQGPAGTNGTNGTNGVSTYTTTTASFIVPAIGGTVVVPFAVTAFLPQSLAGQFFVSIQGAGYFQVEAVSVLNVTLRNPTSGLLGIANSVPGTVISSGALVSLAGAIGPAGAPGVSGAPNTATYVLRTTDPALGSATALDLLAAGYMKTAGSGGSGVVSTTATIPVADISGTLPIANGGTNLTTAPANKIPVGDGTTYLQKEIVGTLPIVVTNSAGNITLSAPSIATFNYVTFTRRVSGTPPQCVGPSVTNPYNATTYSGASYSGIDTASGFNASNGRFVVPFTGYYRIDAYFNLAAVSATATVYIYIRKNGSDIIASNDFNVSSSGYHPISLNYIDQASAITDYYEIIVSTTHDLYVDQGSSFSVQRIQA